MGSAETRDSSLGIEQVEAWRGHRLDDIGGGGVGKVESILVDASEPRPEWLLARMGRFGHHTLVPARDAVEGVGRVWVPYTRELIRQAPRMDAGGSLTAQRERELLAHYGIAGPAGRHAEIAEREPEAITARPPG